MLGAITRRSLTDLGPVGRVIPSLIAPLTTLGWLAALAFYAFGI